MRSLARKEHHDEVESEGTWAVSYGDMVTLLLCFFILFFTVDPQREHQKSLQSGLLQVFENQGVKPGEISSRTGVEQAMPAKPSVDPEMLKNLGARAFKNDEKIVVEFPNVSFFRSGEIKISKEGTAALSRFAKMYLPYAGSYVVGIRAFTDRKAVLQKKNRSFRDNLELSALRSVAATRILQKEGVPLRLIRVGGYGELQETADDLAANRAADGKTHDPKKRTVQDDLARKVVLVIEPGGKTK